MSITRDSTFILNALDQIVNHLDKVELLSNSEFKPAILMRAFIGGTEIPLYTGPTHTQDFTSSLREMVDFPVIRLSDESDPYDAIMKSYDRLSLGISSIIIEQKEYL